MSPTIHTILTDLDGTLLGSDHRIQPRSGAAMRRAMEAGVRVMIATGKTRSSTRGVYEALGLKSPGVFNQGMMVYNAEGEPLQSIFLEDDICRDAISYGEAHDIPTVLYVEGDRILGNAPDFVIEAFNRFGEPPIGRYDTLLPLVGNVRIHKVVLHAEEPTEHGITSTRRDLETRLGELATFTRSVPDFFEIMPLGVSKGQSVAKLLEIEGIDPAGVLAMGDGENDIEMIQLAGVGVAVANASPHLKAVADAVVGTNDEGGVAEAIERFVFGV